MSPKHLTFIILSLYTPSSSFHQSDKLATNSLSCSHDNEHQWLLLRALHSNSLNLIKELPPLVLKYFFPDLPPCNLLNLCIVGLFQIYLFLTLWIYLNLMTLFLQVHLSLGIACLSPQNLQCLRTKCKPFYSQWALWSLCLVISHIFEILTFIICAIYYMCHLFGDQASTPGSISWLVILYCHLTFCRLFSNLCYFFVYF